MAETKRPGTMIYFDLLDPLEALNMEERGQLFTALLEYGDAGKEPAFSGALHMAWLFVKRDMDRDRAKYDDICKKRRGAINKRWKKENPDENAGIQMNTNVPDEYKCIQVYTSDTNSTQPNSNNRKKDKKEKPEKHKHGQYNNVLLTDEELSKLKQEFPTDWEKRIENLSEYIEMKGAKYKSHLATIRNWARREKANQSGKPAAPQPELITPDNWED